MRALLRLAWLALVAACGDEPAAPVEPTPNSAREIVDARLAFDITAMTATAAITFAPTATPGATLEIGDLAIERVTSAGADVPFVAAEARLHLGLAASAAPATVEIAYRWRTHEMFQGASMTGFTFLWPYYCGNLFPCHSDPADGATFALDVAGVPAGKTAVFSPAISTDAPAYQVAWSVGEYVEQALGTTRAGTQLSVWYLPNQDQLAASGTANLVAAFDWLEQTIGPYRFGNHAGTVAVSWPRGGFGGMEHHPRWHVASASLASQETNIHEAAHGWFGDGIRIACWEDFVLSEGTVTYLAARALDVVAPAVGAQTWQSYARELGQLSPTDPVWPDSCGTVDILADDLFNNAPYIRGAFFYKAVADRLGADAIDRVLAEFYRAHAGGAARMADMLAAILAHTGYDATACAQVWLRSPAIPTPGPCP